MSPLPATTGKPDGSPVCRESSSLDPGDDVTARMDAGSFPPRARAARRGRRPFRGLHVHCRNERKPRCDRYRSPWEAQVDEVLRCQDRPGLDRRSRADSGASRLPESGPGGGGISPAIPSGAAGSWSARISSAMPTARLSHQSCTAGVRAVPSALPARCRDLTADGDRAIPTRPSDCDRTSRTWPTVASHQCSGFAQPNPLRGVAMLWGRDTRARSLLSGQRSAQAALGSDIDGRKPSLQRYDSPALRGHERTRPRGLSRVQ